MRLCGISSRFQLLSPGMGQVTHALLTRPPLSQLRIIRRIFLTASLDLHVLSTPPAFILSQDQTLVKSVCSVRMTLAIHPLLLFWKSLASITRINNVRSEKFIFEFSGMVAVQLSMFLFVSFKPYSFREVLTEKEGFEPSRRY